MFQFLGYNLFKDGDSLNNAPSAVNNITSTKLSNAIFDHLNITKNINEPFSSKKPTEWEYDTVINANFDGNLDGGNIDFVFEQISSIKIKRRVKLGVKDLQELPAEERGAFSWITLKEFPVDSLDDLKFILEDKLNANGIEYEYAFVPVINGVEGNYIINSITSKFNGVFIGDAESTYKLLYDVNYGSNSRNQQIGTFEPLGRQFPVVIANGLLSYESGSVSATVMNDNYGKDGKVDRLEIVKKKKILKDFLTNKKPKILKDWNGNLWLCVVVGNVDISYLSGFGMGIPHVNFNWTEVGDSNRQEDLYANGIVDVLE